MATELIQRRWCDWHMVEKDERVEAVEYEAAFHQTGSKAAKSTVVDLCEDCAERFGSEVRALIDRLGVRQASRALTPQQALPGVDGTKKKHSDAGVRFTCPLGCEESLSKSGMKTHLLSSHGSSVGKAAVLAGRTLEGEPVRYVCREKDCMSGFAKPQAMSQHRMQAHGDTAPVDLPSFIVTQEELEDIRATLVS
jgi:hypothetical protein